VGKEVGSRNAQLVRAALEAWNERDLETAAELAHDDIEWDLSEYLLPGGARRISGREQFIEFGRVVFDTFHDSPLELEELIDSGNGKVVATGLARYRPKSTDSEIHAPWFRVFEVEDGKVRRSTVHPSRAAAITAAGIREERVEAQRRAG
jgi:ketosteroid isomerase-like protein